MSCHEYKHDKCHGITVGNLQVEDCALLSEADPELLEPQEHQIEIEISATNFVHSTASVCDGTESQEILLNEHNYASSIIDKDETLTHDHEVVVESLITETRDEATDVTVQYIETDAEVIVKGDDEKVEVLARDNDNDEGNYTDESLCEETTNKSENDQNINNVQLTSGLKTYQIIPGMMAYRDDEDSDMASDTSESDTSSSETESSSDEVAVVADDSDSIRWLFMRIM